MANGIQKQLQFLMYSTPDEDVKVSALVKDETIWLTQKAMGELIGVNVPANSLSHEQAERKAFAEYYVFNKTQKIESDFDKLV